MGTEQAKSLMLMMNFEI